MVQKELPDLEVCVDKGSAAGNNYGKAEMFSGWLCTSGCRLLWEKHSWERAQLEMALLAREMGTVCSFYESSKECHEGNWVRLALCHL